MSGDAIYGEFLTEFAYQALTSTTITTNDDTDDIEEDFEEVGAMGCVFFIIDLIGQCQSSHAPPPPLKTDLLTKFKQMIIALPDVSLVLGDNFDDIFSTTSLEVFLSKFQTVFIHFVNDKSIDEEKRKTIIDSFEFYADRLLDLYTLSSQGNEEELPGCDNSKSGQNSTKSRFFSYFNKAFESANGCFSNNNNNTEEIHEEQLPSLSTLLLKKITEADPKQLENAVKIISPDASSWNCQVYLDDLSTEIIEQLLNLFKISPSDYTNK
ncbi:Uncharacterized protein QTN25_008899 [Entamoeba marina]